MLILQIAHKCMFHTPSIILNFKTVFLFVYFNCHKKMIWNKKYFSALVLWTSKIYTTLYLLFALLILYWILFFKLTLYNFKFLIMQAFSSVLSKDWFSWMFVLLDLLAIWMSSQLKYVFKYVCPDFILLTHRKRNQNTRRTRARKADLTLIRGLRWLQFNMVYLTGHACLYE